VELIIPFPADTDAQEPSGLDESEQLSRDAATALPEAGLTIPESTATTEMTTASVEVIPSVAPPAADFEPLESVPATKVTPTPIEQAEVVAERSPVIPEKTDGPEQILITPEVQPEVPASSPSLTDEASVAAPQPTPPPPESSEEIPETEAGKDITATKEKPKQGAEIAQPTVEPEPKDEYATAMEWVRSQPPQFYTLQLIAVENLKSLQRFIKANALQGKVFTIKTQRDGASWYTLLWGAFTNRDEALQAQSKLPPAVRKGGVWARSFDSLK
jgi:DamX protein